MKCTTINYMQSLMVALLVAMSTTLWATTQETKTQIAKTATQPNEHKNHKKHKKHKRPPLPTGVISMDVVEEDGRVYLLLGKNKDGKQSVILKVSNDAGKTWSAPVHVDTGQTLEPTLIISNDARITVSGKHAVAMWTSYKEGAMHNAGPLVIAHSSDGGKTWQPGNTPADWPDGPHAFFGLGSHNDDMHAVWLDSRFGRSKVRGSQGMRYAASNDGGKTWSKNKTLDDITCACCWTTVAVNDSGTPYVLYRDKQPSDMSIGKINNQKWERLGYVGEFEWDFQGCPHIGGGLVFFEGDKKDDKDFEIHTVVGTGHPDKSGVYYLRTERNEYNWRSPIQLGNESSVHGDIAMSKSGDRIVAVWDMMTDDGLAIFASESSRNQEKWSEPVRISKPGLRASHPRVVFVNGKFLALWTESKVGKIQNVGTHQF